MRYGWRPGVGSAVVWGLVPFVVGLLGLLLPAVLVVIALALAGRALLAARNPGAS